MVATEAPALRAGISFPGRGRRATSSARLGLVLIAPAGILVFALLFVPILLTIAFSFTNMSTATGIGRGAYHVTEATLKSLKERGIGASVVEAIGGERFVVNDAGLAAAKAAGIPDSLLADLQAAAPGRTFANRRDFEQVLRSLNHRPSGTRELRDAETPFRASVVNVRYPSAQALAADLRAIAPDMDASTLGTVLAAAYTGWSWTLDNYRRIATSPEAGLQIIRTAFYIVVTMLLFHIGLALVLAISTFYLPDGHGAAFRAVWFLPRITPPVLYVLLWKWLAWDTGFISAVLRPFGIASRNWMLDTTANAWTFVVLINGFVGASMGMIIFSSAIRSLPAALFHASAVDGANVLQQIRYIILPHLRWPILFVTCYETLSLLTSFEYILLATNGGPGGTTEVWALAAFHIALSNYTGNLDYGYGAAFAVVLVAIGLVLSLAYLRFFNFKDLVTRPRIEQ